MYVAFASSGRRFVVPAEEVAAVGAIGRVTHLPTREPSRLGVTLHQGRVVALLAAGGPGAHGPGVASHLVLLRAGEGTVALAAEELLGLKVEYGDGVPEGFEALDGRRLARTARGGGEPDPTGVGRPG
jgi:hypothetical protein